MGAPPKRGSASATPPLLLHKHHDEPTVFTPANLLREARRQKSLPPARVPRICVLDPDGDIVRWLGRTGSLQRHPGWACYHTDLHTYTHEGTRYGIVGCAVGAPFAVLIAEELFASGCQLLVSITSAGQIAPVADPPYFVLIEKALRDEGTSYHYLPPSDYCHLAPDLLALLRKAMPQAPVPIVSGATWTTDAPFRETATAIEHSQDLGVMAVEMEAAALYAFAAARNRAVVCFAYVTNTMARGEGDFEKGSNDGSHDALRVVAFAARTLTGAGNGTGTDSS